MNLFPTSTKQQILVGDVLDGLRSLPDGCVQCCVTSPPYWGLRDYGHDGQIGLEESPEQFVARLVEVFREVRRVLRDDGTLWLNLGDSYAGSGAKAGGDEKHGGDAGCRAGWTSSGHKRHSPPSSLKCKDLVGIPWRVAFALQADGWWLRQDIIWHKPSPMPESVQDRCTKAHEYVFLLTKSPRYFYDAEAVSEPCSNNPVSAARRGRKDNGAVGAGGLVGSRFGQSGCGANADSRGTSRNRRSVWTIATRPYKGAHFATMPPQLAETCIKAGTSAAGCCSKCGTPLERIVEKTKLTRERPNDYVKRTGAEGTGNSCANTVAGVEVKTVGWKFACTCESPGEPVPCTVLDPFGGSGTTAAVAKSLGHSAILCELNPEYVTLARERIAGVQEGELFAMGDKA